VKVSVIVPVYKDIRLSCLLDSLQEQTLGLDNFEVIVVDNGNSPEISDIVIKYKERLNIIYITEGRKSSYIARNTGIRAASGEFLSFTDADCVADPNWLYSLLEPFKDPLVGGVGGCILKNSPQIWIEKKTRDLAEGQKTTQKLAFTDLPFVVTANAAYRKELVIKLGGFDEIFTSGGDVDLSWRTTLDGYKIVISSNAIIYHNSRTTLRKYFKQYAGYTTGQVLLFKKHQNYHKRKAFFHPYPFRGFIYILKQLPKSVIDFIQNKDSSEIQRLFFEFVMYSGILYGDLRGAIKYKILYI